MKFYNEEYESLIDYNIFNVINYKQYQILKPQWGKALPIMCVNIVKTDEAGNSKRAKSRIVVLGNRELCSLTKSEWYTPIMEQQHICLLVSHPIPIKCILKQGDCESALYPPTLPDNECYIVKPSVDCPRTLQEIYWKLNKMIYGLRRSPGHW